MPTDKTVRKGSYIRKDCHRGTRSLDRKRNHAAGNPESAIRVTGLSVACENFFMERGFKPSISKILQTKGDVHTHKVWTSRSRRL